MKPNNLKWCMICILFTMILACQPSGAPKDANKFDQDSISSPSQLMVKQDAIEVDEKKVYTYDFLKDPKEPLADIPSVEKPAVSPADVVEKTIQPAPQGDKGTFRPPLFTRDCLTRENAEQCSHQFLSAYVTQYIENKKVTPKDDSPLMYVSFILNKEGEIQKGSIRIEPKNYECESCKELAREIVQDMPGWVPGMKNGQLVSTSIRFPIAFKTS